MGHAYGFQGSHVQKGGCGETILKKLSEAKTLRVAHTPKTGEVTRTHYSSLYFTHTIHVWYIYLH